LGALTKVSEEVADALLCISVKGIDPPESRIDCPPIAILVSRALFTVDAAVDSSQRSSSFVTECSHHMTKDVLELALALCPEYEFYNSKRGSRRKDRVQKRSKKERLSRRRGGKATSFEVKLNSRSTRGSRRDYSKDNTYADTMYFQKDSNSGHVEISPKHIELVRNLIPVFVHTGRSSNHESTLQQCIQGLRKVLYTFKKAANTVNSSGKIPYIDEICRFLIGLLRTGSTRFCLSAINLAEALLELPESWNIKEEFVREGVLATFDRLAQWAPTKISRRRNRVESLHSASQKMTVRSNLGLGYSKPSSDLESRFSFVGVKPPLPQVANKANAFIGKIGFRDMKARSSDKQHRLETLGKELQDLISHPDLKKFKDAYANVYLVEKRVLYDILDNLKGPPAATPFEILSSGIVPILCQYLSADSPEMPAHFNVLSLDEKLAQTDYIRDACVVLQRAAVLDTFLKIVPSEAKGHRCKSQFTEDYSILKHLIRALEATEDFRLRLDCDASVDPQRAVSRFEKPLRLRIGSSTMIENEKQQRAKATGPRRSKFRRRDTFGERGRGNDQDGSVCSGVFAVDPLTSVESIASFLARQHPKLVIPSSREISRFFQLSGHANRLPKRVKKQSVLPQPSFGTRKRRREGIQGGYDLQITSSSPSFGPPVLYSLVTTRQMIKKRMASTRSGRVFRPDIGYSESKCLPPAAEARAKGQNKLSKARFSKLEKNEEVYSPQPMRTCVQTKLPAIKEEIAKAINFSHGRKVELTLNGHSLPPSSSVFEAICRYGQRKEERDLHSTSSMNCRSSRRFYDMKSDDVSSLEKKNINLIRCSKAWERVHNIKVNVLPCMTTKGIHGNTNSEAFEMEIQSNISEASEMEIQNNINDSEPSPVSHLLMLIRVLYTIARDRKKIVEIRKLMTSAETLMKADLQTWEDAFMNDDEQKNKVKSLHSDRISKKIIRQLSDPLIICSSSLKDSIARLKSSNAPDESLTLYENGTGIPMWVHWIARYTPFLLSPAARLTYFKHTGFTCSKHLQHLNEKISDGRRNRNNSDHNGMSFRHGRTHNNITPSVPLEYRMKHVKVYTRRVNVLEAACQVLERHAMDRCKIRAEFIGEKGVGLGPTMEFFALASRELQRRNLQIWRSLDENIEEYADGAHRIKTKHSLHVDCEQYSLGKSIVKTTPVKKPALKNSVQPSSGSGEDELSRIPLHFAVKRCLKCHYVTFPRCPDHDCLLARLDSDSRWVCACTDCTYGKKKSPEDIHCIRNNECDLDKAQLVFPSGSSDYDTGKCQTCGNGKLQLEEWGLTLDESNNLLESYPKGVIAFPHLALKCHSCACIHFPGNEKHLHLNYGKRLLSKDGDFVSPSVYRNIFTHSLRSCVGSVLYTYPVLFLSKEVAALHKQFASTMRILSDQSILKRTFPLRANTDTSSSSSTALKNHQRVRRASRSMRAAINTDVTVKTSEGIGDSCRGEKADSKLGSKLRGPSTQHSGCQRASVSEEKEESVKIETTTLYVNHPQGLFPKPVDPANHRTLHFAQRQRRKLALEGQPDATLRTPLSLLRNTGRLIAQAITEGRILDLDLSPALIEQMSDGDASEEHLYYVDPLLYKTLSKLVRLSRAYEHFKFLKKSSSSSAETAFKGRSIADQANVFLVDGCRVEELCLSFVAPGTNIDLIPSGSNVQVTLDNLSDYLRKVFRYLLITSVAKQIRAVKEGFEEVCSTDAFRVLDIYERAKLISGEDGKGVRSWDFSIPTLEKTINCAQGYTLESEAIRYLFEILSEMDGHSKRKFIRYLTGCPRLPGGQLTSLRPKITVVRVPWSQLKPNMLPLASTCTNYLKLPDYPTKDLMQERIYYCIQECPYGFQLS